MTPRCNTFGNSANAASLKFESPNDESTRSQEEQTQMLREIFPYVDALYIGHIVEK